MVVKSKRYNGWVVPQIKNLPSKEDIHWLDISATPVVERVSGLGYFFPSGSVVG